MRITAHGEPNACSTPLSWSSVGLNGDVWKLSSMENCGDERSLMVFSCDNCVFSGDSELRVTLAYSCEALVVTARSVDAAGTTHSLQMPVSVTTGTETSMLATVKWEIAPLLATQRNTVTNTFTKGYEAIAGSAASTMEDAQSTIKPLESSIDVRVLLPIQPFYHSTIISEKVSVLQLLSSIVGLTGIFAGFGIAFGATINAQQKSSSSRKGVGKLVRQKHQSDESHAPVQRDGLGAAAMVGNPLSYSYAPQHLSLSLSLRADTMLLLLTPSLLTPSLCTPSPATPLYHLLSSPPLPLPQRIMPLLIPLPLLLPLPLPMLSLCPKLCGCVTETTKQANLGLSTLSLLKPCGSYPLESKRSTKPLLLPVPRVNPPVKSPPPSQVHRSLWTQYR